MEIQEMEMDTFLFYKREAFIYRMSQTESGRKYLENAWRILQTRPDREALREKTKRKEG